MFGICRVNETKVTSAYSRCGRNEVFNRDFFYGADFFPMTPIDIGTKLLLDPSGRYSNGEFNKPNPIL